MPLGPVVADVGVRTFASVNSTLAQLTGIPVTNAAVSATYQSVQQQLPSVPTLEAFSAANQVGTAQLAIQYCSTMITNLSNNPTQWAQTFPGTTFSASLFSGTMPSPTPGTPGTTGPSTSAFTSALAAKVLGGGLSSQPAASTVTIELNNLIGTLCIGASPCTNTARVLAVASAACAAAFGSADMSIN
jgi:hypothetical protein